jgi:amino acid adenylation domain-containing protein
VYVLDERLTPVPVGVPGELHIAGHGVGRGYHGRPALTAERFVPDPWSDRAGARMYRTGDLARWRSDGELEFLGRIDQQVKVRGYRIELGEIEAALRGHPGVRDAVVATRDDRTLGRCLAAHLVLDGDTPEGALDLTVLQERLGETLPAYMVPALFFVVEALPLSQNGKIDRAALASLEGARLGGGAAKGAPRTPIEEVVTGLFAELLGVPQVGMDEDFFGLGGHSLLGTRLIAALRASTLVDLPLRALFEAPTVSRLAARIEEARRDRAPRIQPIEPAPRAGAMPMSSAQQRLWFLQRLEPDSAAYNVPAAFHLSGPLDRGALRRAFDALVARHEALRTVFDAVHGKPFQRILAPARFDLRVIDCSDLGGAGRRSRIAGACSEDARRPFDLAAAPPWRAALFVASPTEHVLLLNVHHIIADGWSMGILFRELSALYASFARGEEPRLPPPPLQCADHAAWQGRALGGELLGRDLSYWKGQLAGLEPIELPTDRPRPRVQSLRGGRVPAVLSPELATALRALARRHGSTLFMVLVAGLQVLLSRYARQGDVAVGTPIAGRTRRELEGVVGFFANTLVLRCDLGDDPTFAELLGRAREATLDAHDHQDLPFERLVEEIAPARDLSRQPLFQVMLVLQNAGMEPPAFEGLDAVMEPLDTRAAKFDLTFSIHERGGGEAGALRGTLEYNADLFDGSTAERITAHWLTLLAAAVTDPGRRISELPLLTAEEEQRVVGAWNRTEADVDRGLRVHHLFEAQAARTPEAPALASGDAALSYRELDERASRLARRLRSLGVGPDVLVGLVMSRSIEGVIALLAVLKAGGAYVPIDPGLPRERVVATLRDARVALVLSQDGATAALREAVACVGPEPPPVLAITGSEPRLGEAPANAEPRPTSIEGAVHRDNLAYVLFTSGSTGRPKGVAMHHGALVNLIEWQARRFHRAGPLRVMQYAALTFDVSFQEIFSTWRTGGTVVLSPEAVRRDPAALLSWMSAQRIERAFLPPAMLRWLPRHARASGLPTALREVITAGELLVVDGPLTELFGALGRCELDNHYGPTEAHVVTACSLGSRPAPGAAPIGRPIANTRIYVLDDALRPVPAGVPGEVFIGGAGVARGYVSRTGMTAERFMPDPFAGRPGCRMYRTGDLARFRADGTIEFLGRRDHQVKIRGYRVELGEIEAALSSHPGVAHAVAVAREDTGERRLLAYVVPAAGRTLETGELRAHLKQTLPEYMIPAALVLLDRLPLSSNGKLDRRALPAPEPAAQASPDLAPKSTVERRVAEIWEAVLGVTAVGRHDKFFDIGGNSLALLEVQARIEDALGVKLAVAELFREPTIALLAEHLGRRLRDRPGGARAVVTGNGPPPAQGAQRARRELLEQEMRRRVRARARARAE